MFIIIAGKAKQGKTRTLTRLILTSKKKFVCIRMEETPRPLKETMMEYIEQEYKEFFIDDVQMFTWNGKPSISSMATLSLCLEGLHQLSVEFNIDIFVTDQLPY